MNSIIREGTFRGFEDDRIASSRHSIANKTMLARNCSDSECNKTIVALDCFIVPYLTINLSKYVTFLAKIFNSRQYLGCIIITAITLSLLDSWPSKQANWCSHLNESGYPGRNYY